MRQKENSFLRSFPARWNTCVKNVALPIAEIPGKSRDFVLLSGHYDTWYRGAFDNCTANALALEACALYERTSG